MKPKNWLTAAGLASSLALLSLSCSERSSQGQQAATEQAKGTSPSSASSPSAAAGASQSAVAAALSGKLVRLEDGAAVTTAIQGDPQYFVLYHSASW